MIVLFLLQTCLLLFLFCHERDFILSLSDNNHVLKINNNTEASDLSTSHGIFSSKIYDKPVNLNFEIVNFPFLGGEVPRSPSYGVKISQPIYFSRACSNEIDFNNRNHFFVCLVITTKLSISSRIQTLKKTGPNTKPTCVIHNELQLQQQNHCLMSDRGCSYWPG